MHWKRCYKVRVFLKGNIKDSDGIINFSIFTCFFKDCDKQIDKNLYPIKCLFEGAIHVQLENIDFGRQVNMRNHVF